MDRQNGGLRLRMFLFLSWTVFSSVTYGVVCIILSAFSRKIARDLSRIWAIHLLKVGGVKVKVSGSHKLDKNFRYVFIANHQSALDIPVLFAGLTHQLSFIAKKELFFIPFFGWGMAAVGHVLIDRSNARKAHESITKAVKSV